MSPSPPRFMSSRMFAPAARQATQAAADAYWECTAQPCHRFAPFPVPTPPVRARMHACIGPSARLLAPAGPGCLSAVRPGLCKPATRMQPPGLVQGCCRPFACCGSPSALPDLSVPYRRHPASCIRRRTVMTLLQRSATMPTQPRSRPGMPREHRRPAPAPPARRTGADRPVCVLPGRWQDCAY